MSVQVTPHPKWVADLDAALDPSREAILDTRVIVDASENQLADGRIQNFLVGFYPIIRDFPQWLQVLLDRWPEEHAKYDDEHPIHALEIIKSCVQRGEAPRGVTDSAVKSLALMKDAMVASYDS